MPTNPVFGQVAPQNIHQGPGNIWFNVAVPGPQGPLAAPALSQSAGGALTATTYYAKVTYVFANGTESGASPESNFAATANEVLNVASPPAAPGVTGYNVYVSNTAGGASGAETKQNVSPIAIGTPWVEPTSGLVVGTAPLNTRLLIDINGTPVGSNGWQASTLYLTGQQIIDSNGNLQRALTSGVSGTTAPAWSVIIGGETSDSTGTSSPILWQTITIGATFYGGAVEGAVTTMFGAKMGEITADQIAGPIDLVVVGGEGSIEVEMKETDMAKIAQYFAAGTYNAGNDVGLPTGVQAFQENSFGGIVAVPKFSVAVVSPRRNFGGKYVVTMLYLAGQGQPVNFPVSKEKTSTIKMKFTGLFIPTRPQGDQVGKIYWQV